MSSKFNLLCFAQKYSFLINILNYGMENISLSFVINLNTQNMAADVYANLKEKLEAEGGFPKPYLFKFIIPADNKKLALVEAMFGNEAQVSTRQSKTNKYISISAKEIMMSVDEVMKIYTKAGEIEGIISL